MYQAIFSSIKFDEPCVSDRYRSTVLRSSRRAEAIAEARKLPAPKGFEYLGTRSTTTWVDQWVKE